VFIAHDLDANNLRLLRDGTLQAVLHHDLKHDMRQACLHFMIARGALPVIPLLGSSSLQIVTAHNLPREFL